MSSETLRQLNTGETKQLMLEMLEFTHRFCQEHDIRYFLYFGTLLGAVRHKGYIPWDDDMDICMTRTEYERFAKVFNADPSQRYRLLSVHDKGYYLTFSKIIDTHTVLIEPARPHYPLGVYIDLYIIDNLGETREQAKRFSHYVSAHIVVQRVFSHLKWSQRKGFVGFLCRAASFCLSLFLNENALLQWIDRAASRHASDRLSEYVGAVTASRYNERQILRGEWFADTVLLPFEGKQFCAPVDYDHVLKTIYVDYWELPSEASRNSHHEGNRAWLKEETAAAGEKENQSS